MVVVVVVWILLAVVSAWFIGAGIHLSEQRRPVVVDTADGGPGAHEADARELVAAAG